MSRYLQNLLNRSDILFYATVWRKAHFPESSASEPKGWAQAEDLLVPLYMTLNSNPEAWLAWFHIGASLAAQLFSVNAVRKSHFVCTGMGNVDALRSTPTTVSNVVITL